LEGGKEERPLPDPWQKKARQGKGGEVRAIDESEGLSPIMASFDDPARKK